MTWSPLHQEEEKDPLGLLDPTWTCMVCHAARIFDEIHVAYRPVLGMEQYFRQDPGQLRAVVNVRYCYDRATCTAAAHGTLPWPEPVPILQAENEMRVTGPGWTDRIWDAHDERVDTDLTRALLLHLRDEQATMQDLVTAHDQDPMVVFDAARRLVQLGVLEVVA